MMTAVSADLQALLKRYSVPKDAMVTVKTMGFTDALSWQQAISKADLGFYCLRNTAYAPVAENEKGSPQDNLGSSVLGRPG